MKVTELMHGQDWQRGTSLAGWSATEKFDGHRSVWTGRRLLTRAGVDYDPPSWFVAGLPDYALDCELFGGYGQRNRLNGAGSWRDEARWRGLKLLVFDLPQRPGHYLRRRHGVKIKTEIVSLVPVWRLGRTADAKNLLRAIVERGGEGLVCRRPGTSYVAGRVSSLVKLFARDFDSFL